MNLFLLTTFPILSLFPILFFQSIIKVHDFLFDNFYLEQLLNPIWVFYLKPIQCLLSYFPLILFLINAILLMFKLPLNVIFFLHFPFYLYFPLPNIKKFLIYLISYFNNIILSNVDFFFKFFNFIIFTFF
jgi:hypothetical protein